MPEKGIDAFFPNPGKYKSMNCLACKAKCKVERNVMGAASWAESMSGGKHLHDVFTCPNSGKEWHDQAVKIFLAILDMPAPSVREAMEKDLKNLLKLHKPNGGKKKNVV